MLNIGKLGAGAGEYYVGEVASSAKDYYAGRGESAGRWVGSLAPVLGLEGRSTRNISVGFSPDVTPTPNSCSVLMVEPVSGMGSTMTTTRSLGRSGLRRTSECRLNMFGARLHLHRDGSLSADAIALIDSVIADADRLDMRGLRTRGGRSARLDNIPERVRLRVSIIKLAAGPAGAQRTSITVLTEALFDDPVYVDLMPHAGRRSKAMPIYMQAVIRDARKLGATYVGVDDETVVGAAVWEPPSARPQSFGRAARTGVSLARCGVYFPRTLPAAAMSLAKIAKEEPQEPHWYLAMIGVDPAQQGHGHGGALLDVVLDRADAEGLGAYLESSNPKNVPWYERYGFTVTKEIPIGKTA